MRVVTLIRRAADLALVRAARALDGETVALCAAPDEEAQPLLAAARAAGAARLVRVWDAALGTTDYLGVSYALAAAVRAIGDPAATPTLVLAGDRDRGAVGPSVAERLGLPLLGAVVAVDVRDGKIVARRRGRGRLRSYVAAPPALVCLALPATAEASDGAATDDNSARDAKGASEAKVEIEAWTLSRVGLSAAELGYRKHFVPRPAVGPTAQARRFADAAALADRLRADGLVATSPLGATAAATAGPATTATATATTTGATTTTATPTPGATSPRKPSAKPEGGG